MAEDEKHDDLCVLLAAWLLQDAGVVIDEKTLTAVIEASGNRVDPALPLLFAAALDKETEAEGTAGEERETSGETDGEGTEDDEDDEEEEEEEVKKVARPHSGVVCSARGPECDDVVSCKQTNWRVS
jgi:ribosomal protein L12E/L44/L45/RPP1/RPP2